jgi:hypothetical protein
LNINTHQNYIKIVVIAEHKLKLIAISSLFFPFFPIPELTVLLTAELNKKEREDLCIPCMSQQFLNYILDGGFQIKSNGFFFPVIFTVLFKDRKGSSNLPRWHTMMV